MTLSLKGSLVLAVALVVQLAFVLSLVFMHRNALHQIKEELQTQSVIAQMNRVSNLWSSLGADSFRMLVFPNPDNQSSLSKYRTQFASEFSTLKKLTEDPELLKEVNLLEADTNAALDTAAKLKESWERHDNKPFHSYLKESGYLGDLCTTRSNKLIDRLIADQQKIHKAQSFSQTTLNVALVAGLLLNFLIVLVIAYLFTREIADRIAQIEDNSIRLASGMLLQPALTGGDEIAALDQEFHKMSDTLVAQAIKERAVIDNALDLICSLDTNGIFLMVNPASEAVLGRRPADLLGQSYLDFVLQEDRERTQSMIKSSISGNVSEPFEHRVVHTNGTVVELEVSAHWSEADKTLFCVMHDVSKRRQLERLKREFANTITKDLRKPLISTKETLTLLASGAYNSNNAMTHVQSIIDEIKPMLKLISDLLEAEKFDAAMLTLDLQRIDIASFIAESIESVKSAAEEKNIDLKTEIVATDVMIEADKVRIAQALVNLLTNAIRVSPEGSSVSLACHPSPDMVRIEVIDSGPRFSSEELEVLFEPFRQARETGRDRHDVTGLGLLICKSIVEAHHGTIGVVNSGSNRCGSVFWLQLPVTQPVQG